ncbi:hypothetical protein ABEB36_008001 [Hypothenemus hampei]|uniref:Guided entry of tail-anchored proteins factor 1 n=1 Tax=Hypothenemus hampei TaxID=57062 RepID=A0ABD1EKC6_HYPHA
MSVILFLTSTALSVCLAKATYISQWLPNFEDFSTSSQRDLLRVKRELQTEQQQFNKMDDFAKYSKIQRKINAIDQKLKLSKDKENYVLKMCLKFWFHILCSLLLFGLWITYRQISLFKLPDYVDLRPFNYFISYPNGKNQVSLHFWIITCSIVMRSIQL